MTTCNTCRTRSDSSRGPWHWPGWAVSSRIGQLAKIRAAEATLAARVGSIFDDVDVLITPGTAAGPSRIGQYQHRGGVSTLALVASRVPFNAIFNATGQPAAVVPWGLDGEGVPAFPATRRQALRRGDAAGAQPPDRGGPAVGRPPAAGVMTR